MYKLPTYTIITCSALAMIGKMIPKRIPTVCLASGVAPEAIQTAQLTKVSKVSEINARMISIDDDTIPAKPTKGSKNGTNGYTIKDIQNCRGKT